MFKLGLKGAEVARQAGIGEKAYNNYLNGRRMPALPEIVRIAGALETTIDELVGLEPVLSDRDPDTAAAMHRFTANAFDLSAADIQFLADAAMAIGLRHHRERQTERPDRPSLPRLAVAHEELLPAIIRIHAPLEIETVLLHRDDDHDWLQIELLFKRGTDVSNQIRVLRVLTGERMNAQSHELEVTSGSSEPRGVPIVLKLRLGRTQPKILFPRG